MLPNTNLLVQILAQPGHTARTATTSKKHWKSLQEWKASTVYKETNLTGPLWQSKESITTQEKHFHSIPSVCKSLLFISLHTVIQFYHVASDKPNQVGEIRDSSFISNVMQHRLVVHWREIVKKINQLPIFFQLIFKKHKVSSVFWLHAGFSYEYIPDMILRMKWTSTKASYQFLTGLNEPDIDIFI